VYNLLSHTRVRRRLHNIIIRVRRPLNTINYSKLYYLLFGDPQALLGKACACGQYDIIRQTFLNFYSNILTVLFEIKMSMWKKLLNCYKLNIPMSQKI